MSLLNIHRVSVILFLIAKGKEAFREEMSSVKIITIFSAVICCLSNQLAFSYVIPDYCYSDDNSPYLYAGTKTGYEIEHGLIKETTVPSKRDIGSF